MNSHQVRPEVTNHSQQMMSNRSSFESGRFSKHKKSGESWTVIEMKKETMRSYIKGGRKWLQMLALLAQQCECSDGWASDVCVYV